MARKHVIGRRDRLGEIATDDRLGQAADPEQRLLDVDTIAPGQAQGMGHERIGRLMVIGHFDSSTFVWSVSTRTPVADGSARPPATDFPQTTSRSWRF
jgi:hypothetical protein